MALEKEQLIDLYRTMVRIRRFEERVCDEFAAGKIVGFVHSSIGQEAAAVGSCTTLRDDDYITSNHRGHGHIIAKGAKTERMMAELFGKKTGYCKGKGGSMHIADVSVGILGATGIVGAGITIAAGVGLSAKMRGTDQVVISFFGDGASNTVKFHEGINMASIWKLPVIYLCENNQYAISVPQSYHQNIADIADRATAYGIPGVVVDGNDVIAVYEAVTEAVARARRGEGPTIVECKTYRHKGHFEGDPTPYRTKEEVDEWKKKDPISKFKDKLTEMGVLAEKQVDEIDREAREEVDRAVKFAEESPWPDPAETLEDVFP